MPESDTRPREPSPADETSDTPARSTWSRLRRDRAAMLGAGLVTAFLLVALLAPLITAISGFGPYEYDLSALGPDSAPLGVGGGISARHWFGVEPLTGRDLFAVVVHGARTSLLVGLLATLLSLVIGVAIGLIAGYRGGWADRLLSRATDVIFGFPALIFMIAIGAIAPASIPRPVLIVAVIGFFGWPSIARVIRGEALQLRRRNYVVAAELSGASTTAILLREVLPNLAGTIIVLATLSVPGKIGLEAALSFLGVGVPPPTPSWGRSIGEAINWVSVDPMFLIFPGAALVLATLGFNLLGDGLRDALDPRTDAPRPARDRIRR